MRYLYVFNHAEGEDELYALELKTLFGTAPSKKYLISEVDLDPSRSVFIKERLTLMYEAASLEDLCGQIQERPIGFETFKILYLRFPGESLDYRQRLAALGQIGGLVGGEADMYHPAQLLGLAELEDRWLFGILEPNENSWVLHENKPFSYSFSLSVRVSRALANIAIGHDFSQKLIDPCCGVGTVVLEALAVGGRIRGNELNPKVAEKAVANLRHYGHDPVIEVGDIKDVKGHYDTAIIDLPYGHFNPIAPEDQQLILREARRLARKLILVTQVDMAPELAAAGFVRVDGCRVKKGKFVRYITICN